MTSLDSFKCQKTLKVGGKTYVYYSLPAAEKNGLKGISKLPYSMKVLLENLLRNEDGRTVKKDDIVAVAKWLKKRKLEHEIAFRPARVLMQDFTGVPAVVDLAAMRNAMQALGGDAEKINPLVPVDLVIDHSRDRELLRRQQGVRQERGRGIQAESGALRIPEMGPEGVFEFLRGAARHRHLPSGQSRIPRADGVDPQGEDDGRQEEGHLRGRLSGFAGRHRFAHHHGQRPGRARLGRRRHRGGSRDARPAAVDAAAGSDRLQAQGPAEGRRHRHRSGADGDADAAQAGRGRKIRGILRPRSRSSLGRGQGDHRQHGAGIWRDLRLLPGRCRDHRLSQDLGPRVGPGRAGDRLRQGARAVPHRQIARSGVHRNADARSRRRGALDGRTEAPRRPRRAARGRGRLCRGDDQRIQEGRRRIEALSGREPQFRSRPWRRGDRGDHLLHQHLQSERADRRRTAGAQRRRQGPDREALGQDLAGAGQPGGRGISGQFRTAARSRQGRLQPGRLRLHHLHRQFRPAAGRDFEVDQRQRHRRRRRAVG